MDACTICGKETSDLRPLQSQLDPPKVVAMLCKDCKTKIEGEEK